MSSITRRNLLKTASAALGAGLLTPYIPANDSRQVTVQRPRISSPSLQDFRILSDSALKNGMHLVGGPGSGKSRLLGRIIAWQALLRRKPMVLLDPTGGMALNLIDKISRLPMAYRKQLWPRILYVDAGATDFVVPAPLYYRLGEEDTLFAIANRFPSVLKRQDPQLLSAPILGWNSLQECAIFAGQIAAALGRQLDFVADLIVQPRLYKGELKQALAQYPELQPAVTYFQTLMDPNSSALRERRTGSFTNKLLPFVADPTMLATFGASSRGIDWESVVHSGQTVIIDFQRELDPERRQFKLIWWFRDFIEFVKHRGMAGRGAESFFLIDEVTQLLGQRSGEGQSVLAEDLEELVAVLARNYGINVVIAHQNLSQVDERIRNILMQCGTQVLGNIANPDDRLYLARQFLRYDPYWVKKRERVWSNVQISVEPTMTETCVIDHRNVEFTPDEQLLMASEQFRLPRFHFLVRAAAAEGNIANSLYRVTIENLDKGQYPDADETARVLALLRQKCGIPLETLLAEIRGRKTDKLEQKQKQVKSEPAPAILGTVSPPSYDANEVLSIDADTPVSSPAPVTPDGGSRHDPFWK
jgi:hypothetical protein